MLPDPQIRQELSAISGWPTIPQVFIKGELIGGADIVEELAASGELRQRLDEALGTERERRKTVAVASQTTSCSDTDVRRPSKRSRALPQTAG